MTQAVIDEVTDILLRARKTGVRMPDLPNDLKPRSIETVWAIIDAVDARIPEPVAGWKVHAKPGGERCYAPLYPSRIFESPARIPIALAQSLAVEAEISFRLKRDLPARSMPYVRDEVFDAVDACVSFEVVGSRFADVNGMVAKSLIYELWADHMTNGAFVSSEWRSDWQDFDFKSVRVSMRQGDNVIIEKVGGHPNESPADPLVALANIMRERQGMRAGQFLATGSFTSFRPVVADKVITACFEGFGEASCTIVS